MTIEPALVPSIQAYVDAMLNLASHFITHLWSYASFCRALASHAVTAGAHGSRSMVTSPPQCRSMVTSPTQCASSLATSQVLRVVLQISLLALLEEHLKLDVYQKFKVRI